MAAPRTERNGQIVREQQQQQPSLEQFVTKNAQQFAIVLPKHMNPERMTRLAVSAIRTTRHLGDCSLPSFASALMACSVLGLEPNTPLGHAYLIPFLNKGVRECQLIVGYKGMIELMYRSGFVSSVKCTPVFDGDEFDYEYGLHPDIKHRPSKDPNRWNPTKLTHVYPVVRLREQGMDPIWDVLQRGQVEEHRRRSRSGNNGPWTTDYVAMALKTGIRTIATWVPTSTERPAVAAALAYEDASERGRSQQAIAALGDQAQEALAQLGAFPMADEPDEDETPHDPSTGEVTDGKKSEASEREPGVD
jgi:recombination protein RecT